jgi:phosphate transport system ATP-binding protein
MDNIVKINISNLSFSYHKHRVLNNISVQFAENSITAIIGPSGTGKSTFLMSMNRLWENIPDTKIEGNVEIKIEGAFHDVYDRSFSTTRLRRLVGMVFQIPNPLPMSIYKNIAFPLKLAGIKDPKIIEHKVEQVLKRAYLWKEVKDWLKADARTLSGGQQQRLCIARSLITEPEILLFDEPTSSLDAKAGEEIEQLLLDLKDRCTVLVVSHYLHQVKRIADTVAELHDKNLVIHQGTK